MKFSGAFYILAAATLWGTTGTAQALAPEGANPLAVGTLRIAVGGLALLVLARSRGGFRRGGAGWHLPTALFAAVATALYQVTFFGGVALTGVAVGTVVGIGSAPVFAGFLGWAFAGERLSRAWALATVLAVAGCALLILGDGSGVRVNGWGILLALGAGLSYATFALVNKRLLADHLPDEAMAVSFVAGALLLLPLLAFVDTAWVWQGRGLAVVAHLGLIATGLSYALFGRGLRTVSVGMTGTLTLAEPLTAALLGLLLLRETLSAVAFVGMALVIAGLVVIVVGGRRMRRREMRVNHTT